MSDLLESRLTPEQRNDAALIASMFPLEAAAKGLKFYVVNIGERGNPRLSFTVMARSSSEAQEQHECLAEVEERVEALPVDDAGKVVTFPRLVAQNALECAELRDVAAYHRRNDAQARALDQQHFDVLRRTGVL